MIAFFLFQLNLTSAKYSSSCAATSMSQFFVRSRIGCNRWLYLEARSLESLLLAWDGMIRAEISPNTHPKHVLEQNKLTESKLPAISGDNRACAYMIYSWPRLQWRHFLSSLFFVTIFSHLIFSRFFFFCLPLYIIICLGDISMYLLP